MRLHVGTSGYAYKEWKGPFYPEKTSPKEMLRFYGKRLDAVEINYTFYHMPTARVLEPWAEQVPDDFVFTFKAPRIVTHFKRLRNVAEETDYFFNTLSMLGAVLCQFPANFPANRPLLEEFLRLVPDDVPCAFEFRSPTWLEAGVPDLLADTGHCLCTADTDDAPAEVVVGAARWGYLRLRRSSGYREAELSRWLKRIRAPKWERAFVFFKHEEEARGPGEALRFRELARIHGTVSGR